MAVSNLNINKNKTFPLFNQGNVEQWYNQIGLSRSQRKLGALNPNSVNVDEQSLSDLFSFCLAFATNINFYQLDNQVGSKDQWENFFNNDPSIFLASIVCTTIDIPVKKFQILHKKINRQRKWQNKVPLLLNQIDLVFELFLLITEWHKKIQHLHYLEAKQHQSSSIIREFLLDFESAIDPQMVIALKLLFKDIKILHKILQKESIDIIVDFTYHSIWRFEEIIHIEIEVDPEKANQIIKEIILNTKHTFDECSKILIYIIHHSQAYFQRTLLQNQHSPNNALYITFCKLFRFAQNELNTITKRHLDFYYREVLRLKPAPSIPDQAIVTFQLTEKAPFAFLQKGLQLSAGKGANGKDQFYALDEDIIANPIVIKSLKTLFLSKGNKRFSDLNIDPDTVNQIFAAPVANSADGLGKKIEHPELGWPTFGEDQFQHSDSSPTIPQAIIGYAVSLPILELSEGNRSICLWFSFSKASFNYLEDQIFSSAKNQANKAATFYRFFQDAFVIKLTTKKTWLAIQDYEFLIDEDRLANCQFGITINLDNAQPAIEAYNKKIHKGNFITPWPILHLSLNTEIFLYPYSFLAPLKLEKIKVDVKVNGLKNLSLSNDNSKLPSHKPFPIFGISPIKGSTFYIGSSELFRKQLNQLSINIDWTRLPISKNFSAYYQNYILSPKINNASFKIKIQALANGQWFPTENQLEFDLFQIDKGTSDETGNEIVQEHSSFVLSDIEDFNISPDLTIENPLDKGITKSNDFLKLELCDPTVAFGHSVYNDQFVAAVTHNANYKNKTKLPIPNRPFVPIAKSISVDYSASTELDFLGPTISEDPLFGKSFIIYPFGYLTAWDAGKVINNNLLPEYHEDGYLYIGLEHIELPEILSFLFYQKPFSKFHPYAPPPKLELSFLSGDNWIRLEKKNLLVDNTNGLTNSGIIKISLPQKIQSTSTLMPAGLFWLRLHVTSIQNSIDLHTIQIYTNAVTATWVNNGDSEHLKRPLPPGKIKSLVVPNKKIKKVFQPLASIEGVSMESEEDFFLKVSERLRHKGRAVTEWDYERLLLERFPTISYVVALKATNYKNYDSVSPGHVTIVVIPKHWLSKLYFAPKASYSELQQIRSWLVKRNSPFAKIEVINPLYEQVKVICQVTFVAGDSDGYYIKQLNEALRKYLSPWFYDVQVDLRVGNVLHKADIQGFIEKQDYIAYVESVHLVKLLPPELNGTELKQEKNKENQISISGLYPWSILISAKEHTISTTTTAFPTKGDSPIKEGDLGISNMSVDVDFVIGLSEPEENETMDPDPKSTKYDPSSNAHLDNTTDRYVLLIKQSGES